MELYAFNLETGVNQGGIITWHPGTVKAVQDEPVPLLTPLAMSIYYPQVGLYLWLIFME